MRRVPIAIVPAVAAAALLLGCVGTGPAAAPIGDHPADAPGLRTGPETEADAAPTQPAVRSGPVIGFNLVSWGGAEKVGPDAWREAVEAVHAAGLRDVSLVTWRFVDARTGRLGARSAHGLASPPSDAALTAALARAKALGMTVSLNPFVEIDNPDGIGHRWRGMLRFEGPKLAAFFADYGRYVGAMAALAQAGRADRLYVGSELRGLATDPGALPRWRQVIARARAGFGGRLSYAANHDSYVQVPFWDRLDEIGIDAYFPLVPRAEAEGAGQPSAARLEAAWREVLAKVEAFSRATRRPVVFSEWGCVPRDGTTAAPSRWSPSETPDSAEQEAACAALLAAAGDAGDWLVGVQLWHWRMPGGDSAYAVGPGSKVARLAATAREAKEDVRP